MLKINFLTLLGVFLLSASALADTEAIVVQDPTYIYKKPDFDAEQIGQLQVGQRILVSTEKWGPFHKTKVKKGVSGFVSDADVEVATDKKPDKKPKPEDKPATDKPVLDAKTKKRGPWWNSPMVGLAFGFLNYTEVVRQQEQRDRLFYFGAKASLPIRLLDIALNLDLNAMYSPSAPMYYRAESDPTGYLVLIEAPVQFQLVQFWDQDGMIYLGAGPILNYLRVKVIRDGILRDESAFGGGAVANVGMAFSLGRTVLKIEPRYYLQRSGSLGVTINLQYIF